MPRPPESDDYVVLLGWTVEGLHKDLKEAEAQARAIKQQEPYARVVVAKVIAQMDKKED